MSAPCKSCGACRCAAPALCACCKKCATCGGILTATLPAGIISPSPTTLPDVYPEPPAPLVLPFTPVWSPDQDPAFGQDLRVDVIGGYYRTSAEQQAVVRAADGVASCGAALAVLLRPALERAAGDGP